MARPPACGDETCLPHAALALLGKPHVLDLLYALVQEDPSPWRFNRLRDRLGIAPNILADRLRALERTGLVVREEHKEMPPRVEYTATPDALELADAFRAFERWTARRHTRRLTASIPSSPSASIPA